MRMQLSLSAEDLPKSSLMSGPPNPFAVVTLVDPKGGKPTLLGQTEVLEQTNSPDWTKIFYVDDFELGKPMNMIVSIYSSNKNKKTSLGSSLWEVGWILGAPGSRLAKQLKDGGVLCAHVEQATGSGTLQFQLRALNLVNTEGGGVFNKSDPFFELQRWYSHPGVWDTVFRSRAIFNNLQPVWNESFVEMDALCGGHLQQKFRLVVFDYEKGGKHDIMGKVRLTVEELLGAVNPTALRDVDSIDTEQSFVLTKGFSSRKPVGKILVVAAQVTGALPTEEEPPQEPIEPPMDQDIVVDRSVPEQAPVNGAAVQETMQEGDIADIKPTFANYISGGCELRVVVAIDATASNGNPREETSLHHFNDDGYNAYEQVLFSLCSILSKYDSDQKYPVYGFGAKQNGQLSHCFPIGSTAEVDGVDGILQAYKKAFRSGIVMSSPRDFSEVIQKAAQDANKQLEKGQFYSILLLFTNGAPADIGKTENALKEAADTPLSIVIVGVGNGSFAGIQQLESQASGRDNPRFVHYNALQSDQVKLTEAALDHIPVDLVSFFVDKNIFPEPELELDEIAVEPYSEQDDIEAPIEINEQGQAVVTGEVNVSNERKEKFDKIMKEGQKFLKKHKRLVGRIKKHAGRKIKKLLK